MNDLLGLLASHGELPEGFDPVTAGFRVGPTSHPTLVYQPNGAILTIYSDEPLAPSIRMPGAAVAPPPPTAGPTRPRWLRATLRISRDYVLKWHVERFVDGPGEQWVSR